MAGLQFVRATPISLRNHAEFDERWVQDRISEDPSILGLGDLILKDKERIQPKAGRLDLLLQDADADRRYEVEIQLGASDESHIIRAIEYWDIERKRYPQYDHCAVIVAEDITSRFLNVINLFNGSIPLVAIQMNALRIGDEIALVFTTVLDELTLGLEEDDEGLEVTDRAYWETKRGTRETVALADRILELIHTFAPGYELKYNKFYIGLIKDGKPKNFVMLIAKKAHLRLEVRMDHSDEVQQMLDAAGLDVMDYNKRWRMYRIRLTKDDIKKHEDTLIRLMEMAYLQFGG